jgi:Holliday junction resolvase-like predicted endonuclease
MSSKARSFQERGITAASAYLTRVGFNVIHEDFKTNAGDGVDLVALDGSMLVLINVDVMKNHDPDNDYYAVNSDELDSLHAVLNQLIKSDELDLDDDDKIDWRFDRISIIVLVEDEDEGRALLRHHRSVYSES